MPFWSLPPGSPLSARANALLEVPRTVICDGDIDLIPVVTLVITYARAIHALTTKDFTLTLDYRGAVVSVSRNSSLSSVKFRIETLLCPIPGFIRAERLFCDED
jgi:hypothetical protein